MRVPGGIGARFLCAGTVALALAVACAGVAEAKPKSKRAAAKKATVTRTVAAAPGNWKRGYADFVIDAKTGKVLHEENADELRHPASLTKIMTLYLLFEQLDAGRMKLDTEMPVSAYAASQQPSKLGVRPGTTVDVDTAIKALVTRSANDVSVVIAEQIGGTSENFARMMTRKARALGMSRTTFRNPNGLPHPEQVTTARDFVTLGRAIQERFPRYYPYFAIRSFNYRGVAVGNHNKLLGRVQGVDGIKTGYTNASGFNLVTNVNTDGRHVVAAVFGGSSGGARDARMAALIKDALPRAYAGRPTVTPVAERAVPVEDEAPAVAAAPAPAAKPVIALGNAPRVAMASAAPLPEPVQAEMEPATTASIPPAPAPKAAATIAMVRPAAPVAAPAPVPAAKTVTSAELPAPGSAAPIVPRPVKTVAVARPAAPTATLSNQPGVLGTLTFSGGETTARRAAPVQVASAGQIQIPSQALAPQPAPARPAAPVAAAPKGGWGIQIGAFGSEADAQAQLAKAKSSASGALGRVDSYTQTASKGSTQIVRARFAGFDAEAAAQNACKALKRSDFSCMVFRN
ncbi:D-alanyl-D-alanine carboxypeptidase [Ancylobacter terrae]|uniref:D-alanyl-D-alanine carboxypeptidase n=1 Tax=Ancylobacter sp. sgz301288 TaxID=3342077 RepID=UPI00385D4D3D